MPGFNAHLSAGVLTGALVSSAGYLSQDLDTVQAGAVFVLGTTGGLLPDIDSDTGKPLALLFQLLSVLLPILAYPHFKPAEGPGTCFLLCYFPAFYLAINYLVCPVVKKLTRHRGMMHSLPFALVAAEAAYLLLVPSGRIIAFYGCLAVFFGCLAHLFLDELNAMSIKFGVFVVVKRSSGSALKLVDANLLSTALTYGLLAVMTWAVFSGVHA